MVWESHSSASSHSALARTGNGRYSGLGWAGLEGGQLHTEMHVFVLEEHFVTEWARDKLSWG